MAVLVGAGGYAVIVGLPFLIGFVILELAVHRWPCLKLERPSVRPLSYVLGLCSLMSLFWDRSFEPFSRGWFAVATLAVLAYGRLGRPWRSLLLAVGFIVLPLGMVGSACDLEWQDYGVCSTVCVQPWYEPNQILFLVNIILVLLQWMEDSLRVMLATCHGGSPVLGSAAARQLGRDWIELVVQFAILAFGTTLGYLAVLLPASVDSDLSLRISAGVACVVCAFVLHRKIASKLVWTRHWPAVVSARCAASAYGHLGGTVRSLGGELGCPGGGGGAVCVVPSDAHRREGQRSRAVVFALDTASGRVIVLAGPGGWGDLLTSRTSLPRSGKRWSLRGPRDVDLAIRDGDEVVLWCRADEPADDASPDDSKCLVLGESRPGCGPLIGLGTLEQQRSMIWRDSRLWALVVLCGPVLFFVLWTGISQVGFCR